jgi:hypothetical protein
MRKNSKLGWRQFNIYEYDPTAKMYSVLHSYTVPLKLSSIITYMQCFI